jgi:sterol desaturase/sphingolipid hydroxylase (fatty acid hydroxylase superfamily)
MEALLDQFKLSYFIIITRYLGVAAIFFIIFYVFLKKKISFKKIQKKFPGNNDYQREIFYSFISVLFFAGTSSPFFVEPFNQYSNLYFDFGERPIWYYILCFPIMTILHDTYFYWMHRAIHHPKIFKTVHLLHHKSTNPSPWAAYSFHPIEGFLESLIFPIIILILPVHISALGLFFLFQIIYNVYGHLGYELYPKGFHKHWFGKWINTSVHHNLHHKYFDNAYGLYFTFWDRMMGTMAPQYDEVYEEVKSRKK